MPRPRGVHYSRVADRAANEVALGALRIALRLLRELGRSGPLSAEDIRAVIVAAGLELHPGRNLEAWVEGQWELVGEASSGSRWADPDYDPY